MFTSLLKIGLLSFISCVSPLKAVSSSLDHTADSEVTFKADVKRFANYGNENTLSQRAFRVIQSGYPTSWSRDKEFSMPYDFKLYTANYSFTYVQDCILLRYVKDVNTPNYAYLNAYTENSVTHLGMFDFSVNTFYFNDDYVVIFDEVLNVNGSTFENFSQFFQNTNFDVNLFQRISTGAILGSNSIISTDSSGWDISSGFSDGVLAMDVGNPYLYKFAQGLFYFPYNNTFYTSICYDVIGVANMEFYDGSTLVTTPSSAIMVGRLYFVNGLSSEQDYANSVEKFCFAWVQSKAVDGEYTPTSAYSYRWSEFIVIGDELADVETVNKIEDNLLFSYDVKVLNNASNMYDSGISDTPFVNDSNLLVSTLNLMDDGFKRIFGFLQINILPGISLGTLILIPFALTILLFILRLFKR